MLSGRKESLTAQDMWIPQGKLSVLKSSHNEPLPNIVLQDEVAEEPVVRNIYAELISECPPRFDREEVVQGQQSAAPQDHRPEEKYQQTKQAEDDR